MSAKKIITVCAVVLITTTLLQATVIPGRWELVDSLESGTPIIVEFKAGNRMECSLQASSQDRLELIDETDRVVTISKSEVKEILGTVKENDSPMNGTLWGLAIGGIGGTVAGAATSSIASNEGGSAAGWAATVGLVGAGIGGLIGFVGDAAQQSRPILYRAPEE